MPVFVTVQTRERIEIRNKPLGVGGEADVYVHPANDRQVLKIYHRFSAQQPDKLRAMLAAPPQQPTIANYPAHFCLAWPTDCIQDPATGKIVGYVMPRVRGMRSVVECYNRTARATAKLAITPNHLFGIAINLTVAVAAVHARGYVVGDINQKNILVLPDAALVTLIDTDSFQVPGTGTRVYTCPVITPEFAPPELHGGVSLEKIVRNEHHDNFSLAILIFYLLMDGTHPFQGIFPDGQPRNLDELVRLGRFPYIPRSAQGGKPPPLALPLAMLSPQLRSLFEQCLVDGHTRPGERPSALAWSAALREAMRCLRPCDANDRHQYLDHLLSCPYCDRDRAEASVLPARMKQAPVPNQEPLDVLLGRPPAIPRTTPARPPVARPQPAPLAASASSPVSSSKSYSAVYGSPAAMRSRSPSSGTAPIGAPDIRSKLRGAAALLATGALMLFGFRTCRSCLATDAESLRPSGYHIQAPVKPAPSPPPPTHPPVLRRATPRPRPAVPVVPTPPTPPAPATGKLGPHGSVNAEFDE